MPALDATVISGLIDVTEPMVVGRYGEKRWVNDEDRLKLGEIKLYGCINDIDNMKEVFIKQYVDESSNIIILRDDTTSKCQPAMQY